MKSRYVPERGDVVWLTMSPQAGHEQAGHRPALVLSPRAYNGKVGLALVCPLTSHVKGYPFEVALPADGKAKGAVLCDQVRSVDWRARGAHRFERVSDDVVEDVVAKIVVLLRDDRS